MELLRTSLKLIRRRDRDGNWSIAPFIDGKNIGEFPEKQWNNTIGDALKSAYERGFNAAREQILKRADIHICTSASNTVGI